MIGSYWRNLPTCAFVAVTLIVCAAAAGESLEYAVKAVFLYKFGNFVEWPNSAFESPSSAVNVCVVGNDPFGDKLDTAVTGQHIGDRAIVVRRVAGVGRDSGCQILFAGGPDPGGVAQALDAVRGTGVLTVSDIAGSGDTPSIIRFVLRDGRVGFVIDARAASLNGITISSKLMNLAQSVTPNPAEGWR